MKSITVKVTLEGNIIPTNNLEKMYLVKTAVINKTYRCKLTNPRKQKTQGLYWLICQGMAFHFGVSADFWHNQFKNILLEKTRIKNVLTGQMEWAVKSTAYESMDQEEFQEYFSNVITLLTDREIDYHDLLEYS